MDHPFLFSAYVWTQSSGFSRLCMHLVFCIQKDQFYVHKFWIADILFNTNKNPKNEIANNNKVNIIVYQSIYQIQVLCICEPKYIK